MISAQWQLFSHADFPGLLLSGRVRAWRPSSWTGSCTPGCRTGWARRGSSRVADFFKLSGKETVIPEEADKRMFTARARCSPWPP